MAEGKKRRGRRAYLDDFQRTATGEYVYNGQLHHFDGQKFSRGRGLRLLWVCSAVMAASVIAAGCVPAAGMLGCPYVILPYAGALLSVSALIWLMCRLTAGGDPLRDYVYNATVKQFKLRSILVLAFSGCTLVGDIVYLIVNGAGGMLAGTAAFLICMALCLGGALAWKSIAGSLSWSK